MQLIKILTPPLLDIMYKLVMVFLCNLRKQHQDVSQTGICCHDSEIVFMGIWFLISCLNKENLQKTHSNYFEIVLSELFISVTFHISIFS